MLRNYKYVDIKSKNCFTFKTMDVSNQCRDYKEKIEKYRKVDFRRLKDTVYLDHSGTTLYADSQLEAITRDLTSNLYGNPHSRSESSQLSTDVIDQVRYKISQFLNADLDRYNVIFTSGATGAIKLIAETFDWGNKGKYLYLDDNHTSVLGVRSVAKQYAVEISSISADDVSESFQQFKTQSSAKLSSKNNFCERNCLFAYPSQSSFCGRKYPLDWIHAIQNGALDDYDNEPRKNWFVLLDAAGSVATSRLDLQRHQPDFVCFSFHKMFGYPTGLGCLLVHRRAEKILNTSNRYFGGGSVLVASATTDFHIPRSRLNERLESGTVAFLDILAVKHGFDQLLNVSGTRNINKTISVIGDYTFHLAQYVHYQMRRYHHSNGQPAVVLYCHGHFEDATTQGAIVNFNLLQSDGQFIGFAKVETLASAHGIHLRTGCMCNPGACQKYLNLSFEDLQHHFEAGHICGDDKDLIDGKPTGSVRISFGYMSTIDDAQRFLHMIESCFVDSGEDQVNNYLSTYSAFDELSRGSGDVDHCVENALRKPLWRSPDVAVEIDERRKPHHLNLKNSIGSSEQQDVVLESFGHQPAEVFSEPIAKKDLDAKQEDKLEDLSCCCFSSRQRGQSCCGSHITAITLYPIKSCGGFEVSSWKVGKRGFLYDRNWMIVSNGGVSLTQKKEPKMCFIKPEIDLQKQILRMHCRGLPSIELPLESKGPADSYNTNVNLCQTKICGDRIDVIDCGEEVARWLSKALQREDDCRLLQQCSHSNRIKKSRVKKDKAINNQGVNKDDDPIRSSLSLANEAQFLMLNRESAKFLVRQMAASDIKRNGVDQLLARFRGNLIVDGMPAFAEEQWTCIDIAGHRYKVDGMCNRCQMICIDQKTGVKSQEPLAALASIREKKMQFGVYLTAVLDQNTENELIIRVGDPVMSLPKVYQN